MNDELKSICPLCKRPSPQVKDLFPHPERTTFDYELGFLFHCPSCGQFIVSELDLRHTLLKRDHEHVHSPPIASDIDVFRLSTLLRERNIRRGPTVWLRFRDDKTYGMLVDKDTRKSPSHVHMQATELLSHWPHTVPEKLTRTLLNLAALSPNGGARVRLSPSDWLVCFASDQDEFSYHIDSLAEQELLGDPDHRLDGSEVVVSPAGWARVDELMRGTGSSINPAFVAMWFGGDKHEVEMTALYKEAIEPAANLAGYRVGRVNAEEFNDFIMDKVLGDIRLAPFVVADFTGNRGGVYLEAGFARGLGKPVIHTCKKEDFDEAHFDIKQINTIKWTKPGDLREKLHHRIIATLGPGPYKKRET